MKFLDQFLRSKLPQQLDGKLDEQAVLVYFMTDDLDGSINLQHQLNSLLCDSTIGMFDGNEVGGGELVLYMYGPDAELLFRFIEPTLRADEFCRGARVLIRWGGPAAPQREVII